MQAYSKSRSRDQTSPALRQCPLGEKDRARAARNGERFQSPSEPIQQVCRGFKVSTHPPRILKPNPVLILLFLSLSLFPNYRKKFLGHDYLDGHIVTGRTAVDMPELPLAPLQKSVVACHTGPGKGLTDLSQDPDPPSDDVYLDRGERERERGR